MKDLVLIKKWNAKDKAEKVGKDLPITCMANLWEAGEVRIEDCSGVYQFKRLNEFGDCALYHDTPNGYECVAYAYPARRNSIRISTYKAGITYDKIIKFSQINRIHA